MRCYDNICSNPAYYKYKSRNPEYAALVESAKQDYTENSGEYTPPDQAQRIRENLNEALERESRDGYVVRKRKTQKDPEGNVIGTTEEEIVSPPRESLIKKYLTKKAAS